MVAAILRVRLLGAPDLRLGGAALPPLESARALSLLAYLLLHREAAQPRQRLAFPLWPDSTEAQARTNLRHVLHTLRRTLPGLDRYLEVTPRTLAWRADPPFWLDVAAFEELADGDPEALAGAVALYRGDLLEGLDDEWLAEDRERLRRRCLQALERLVALLAERGDHAGAIPYAERLLRQDPLQEAAWRTLMGLHDARGDRARALHVYHACAATLERELGVEPSPPTRRAYEALLGGQGSPDSAGPAAGRAGPLGGPPLVGRAAQQARLQALWQAAEGGQARLVVVTGEAGIGKTRLVEELRAWCARRGVATADARSYPAEGALAYGPVVAWLRSEALAGPLRRLDPPLLGQLARLLPELQPAAPDPPGAGPDGDRRRLLFDALVRALLATGRPLLLVADDLQWVDRETLPFLHYLLRARPPAALLVVATVRGEEVDDRHPLRDLLTGLGALDRVAEVELGRLSGHETAALARAAGRPLTAPEAGRLFADTEGNPLFVVETLRAGWGSDGTDPGPLSPRVQAVIEARLAQLSPPARELVGVAATIGREFTADTLSAASGTEGEALVLGLDELWRRRIVRDRGPDAYDFTHDRIREVAYLALSPARRRHTHQLVAAALARLNPDDQGPVAAQLAAHHEAAGAVEQAAGWYERAAAEAQRVSANAEAVRLLERVLELHGTLPPTPGRRARELAVLTTLPTLIGQVEGYGSDRVAEVQDRGLELAGALGVEPEPPLLRSLAIASLVRGDFVGARRVGARLRVGGERDRDAMRVVEGDYVLGIAAFWQGDLEAARGHFEAAVDRYRPEDRPAHLVRYELDPKVICLSRLGNTLWFLGRPAAATRSRDAALALADEVGHPYSRATALVFAALLALELGDADDLRRRAGELRAWCRQHQARTIEVPVEAFAGYLDVLDGHPEAGLGRIRGALDDCGRPEDAPGLRASILRVLLEAAAAAGDTRGRLSAADLALAPDAGTRLWESEARRHRAEALAALGAPTDTVEAELDRALQVARRQGARMLELRAEASLLHHRADPDPERRARRGTPRGTPQERPAGQDRPVPTDRQAEVEERRPR